MRKLFLASTALMAVSWAAGAQTIAPGNGTLTDAAGNVWLSNAGNNSVTEILGVASQTLPIANAVTSGGGRP